MTFEEHLRARGLSDRTVHAYGLAIAQAETQGLEPPAWLAAKVTPETPRTTITVYRSAVAAWLRWREEERTGEAPSVEVEVQIKRLVPARKGREGVERTAPTPAQFALWVSRLHVVPDPERTLLRLLPFTGLRVSEACGLRQEDVMRLGSGRLIRVLGKGNKERVVPLSRGACDILLPYIEREQPPAPWVFWRRPSAGVPAPRPLRVHEVDRAAAKVRGTEPELADVVPHAMRHLYATTALRAGMPLRVLQVYLGHASMTTTTRYTHPDAEMMAAGAEAAGALLEQWVREHEGK